VIVVDPKQFDELNKKLDLISRLLSLNLVKDLESITLKVRVLHSCGFKPNEIAVLLNKEPNHIHQILHKLKTKKTAVAKGEQLESEK
jgi:hypothetical protein